MGSVVEELVWKSLVIHNTDPNQADTAQNVLADLSGSSEKLRRHSMGLIKELLDNHAADIHVSTGWLLFLRLESLETPNTKVSSPNLWEHRASCLCSNLVPAIRTLRMSLDENGTESKGRDELAPQHWAMEQVAGLVAKLQTTELQLVGQSKKNRVLTKKMDELTTDYALALEQISVLKKDLQHHMAINAEFERQKARADAIMRDLLERRALVSTFALNIRRRHLVSIYFRGWKSWYTESKTKKIAYKHIQWRMNRLRLQRVFEPWQHWFSHRKHLRHCASIIKRRREQRRRLKCIRYWKRFHSLKMSTRQAEGVVKDSVLQDSFETWRLAARIVQHRRQRITVVLQNVSGPQARRSFWAKHMLQKVLAHWRGWWIFRTRAQAILSARQAARSANMLRDAWMLWNHQCLTVKLLRTEQVLAAQTQDVASMAQDREIWDGERRQLIQAHYQTSLKLMEKVAHEGESATPSTSASASASASASTSLLMNARSDALWLLARNCFMEWKHAAGMHVIMDARIALVRSKWQKSTMGPLFRQWKNNAAKSRRDKWNAKAAAVSRQNLTVATPVTQSRRRTRSFDGKKSEKKRGSGTQPTRNASATSASSSSSTSKNPSAALRPYFGAWRLFLQAKRKRVQGLAQLMQQVEVDLVYNAWITWRASLMRLRAMDSSREQAVCLLKHWMAWKMWSSEHQAEQARKTSGHANAEARDNDDASEDPFDLDWEEEEEEGDFTPAPPPAADITPPPSYYAVPLTMHTPQGDSRWSLRMAFHAWQQVVTSRQQGRRVIACYWAGAWSDAHVSLHDAFARWRRNVQLSRAQGALIVLTNQKAELEALRSELKHERAETEKWRNLAANANANANASATSNGSTKGSASGASALRTPKQVTPQKNTSRTPGRTTPATSKTPSFQQSEEAFRRRKLQATFR